MGTASPRIRVVVITADDMKLISFSVDKYRSITRAGKLSIKDMTILIGPNNEGKSNLLRALVTALDIVAGLSSTSIYRGRLRSFRWLRTSLGQLMRPGYDWTRDFPVSLQAPHPEGESIFNLDFQLTDDEVDEFRAEVGSSLDGFLPIQITVGKKEPGFKIRKRGPGARVLSKKAQSIARFIGDRFEFQYIPAIRTAEDAEKIIREMVDRELRRIEDDPAFRSAREALWRHYAPILNKLSETITNTLQGFLPNIENAAVKMSEEATFHAMQRSVDIVVDDGTPTSLRLKGDGVQSLAALAMLRYLSESEARGKSLVLAIEEPESHLHPRAIHLLKAVLQEISSKRQVIVTTHCPLFINRRDVASNILVTGNRAAAANTTEQIREILGVRASDNLRGAELVLVVEGEEDRTALTALLSALSPSLRAALETHTLAVDSLVGGSNLPYKLSLLRDALYEPYCFLDHDDCGRRAFDRARQEGLVSDAEVTFAACQGMQDSEIEDLYRREIYAEWVAQEYGVTLDTPAFKSAKKWSERMRDVFVRHGKAWDVGRELGVKRAISEFVAAAPLVALEDHKRSAVDSLVRALESKLQAMSAPRSATTRNPPSKR